MSNKRDHIPFMNWLLEQGFIEVPENMRFLFQVHGKDKVFLHRSNTYVLFRWDTGKGDPHFYYFYVGIISRTSIPTETSYGECTDDIKAMLGRFIERGSEAAFG